MAITLLNTMVTRGGNLLNSSMTVTVNPAVPVGALMMLGIVVHGRNNEETQHAYPTTVSGWELVEVKDNFSSPTHDTDYFQTWVYAKLKVAGDESWIFKSTGQLTPTRIWVLTPWTGAVVPGSWTKATAGSQTNTTGHKFTGLTATAAGQVFFGVTSRIRAQMSAVPTLTFIQENTKAGDANVDQSVGSVWYQTLSASGATGDYNYTAIPTADYTSVSVLLEATTGVQTVGGGDGVGFGAITVPGFAGLPLLRHSIDAEVAAFNRAMFDEGNVPILLATLDPLDSDAPYGEVVELKFSSGRRKNQDYQPVIEKWPELTRALYGTDSAGVAKVGGRVGFTSGSLELLNDKDAVPGDQQGLRVFSGGQMKATAEGAALATMFATIAGRLDAEASGSRVANLTGALAGQLDAEADGEVTSSPYPAISDSFAQNSDDWDGDGQTRDHLITLPAHAAGDRIIVFFASENTSAGVAPSAFGVSSAFDYLGDVAYNHPTGGNCHIGCYYINATGPSEVLRIRTSSVSDVGAQCSMVLASGTFDPKTPPEFANLFATAPAQGTSTAPDAAAYSATWGADYNLFTDVSVWRLGAHSTWPSGYSMAQEADNFTFDSTHRIGCAIASMQANAASDDAGASAIVSSGIWGAASVVSRPTRGSFGFPTVGDQTSGNSAANTTSHTITLPSHASGDRLLVFFQNDGNATVSVAGGSSSFTNFANTASGSATRMTAWYLDCSSGAEVLTLTTSASEGSAWISLRINAGTFDAGFAPISGAASGSSANPKGGKVQPLQSGVPVVKDHLFLDVSGWDGNNSFSSYSVPYALYRATNRWADSNGVGIALGARELAATQDYFGDVNHAYVSVCTQISGSAAFVHLKAVVMGA